MQGSNSAPPPPPPPPLVAVGIAMAAERKVARVRTNEVFILMVGFGCWGKKLEAFGSAGKLFEGSD